MYECTGVKEYIVACSVLTESVSTVVHDLEQSKNGCSSLKMGRCSRLIIHDNEYPYCPTWEVYRMRKEFSFPDVDKVNWFIGHMVKGIRKATRKLERCDCVIELRDARVSFKLFTCISAHT